MSQENVEIVDKLVALTDGIDIAVVRDDAAWAERRAQHKAIFEPDCEFAWIASGGTVGLEARGVDGLRERHLELFGAWETVQTECEQLIPVGDKVVALLRLRGRMAGSENEVQNFGAGIYFVRDGRIARAEFYANRADGLAAAGLRG